MPRRHRNTRAAALVTSRTARLALLALAVLLALAPHRAAAAWVYDFQGGHGGTEFSGGWAALRAFARSGEVSNSSFVNGTGTGGGDVLDLGTGTGQDAALVLSRAIPAAAVAGGTVDLVLDFAAHNLVADGYQGLLRLGLFPTRDPAAEPVVALAQRLHRDIDHTWYTLANASHARAGGRAGRAFSGKLRLTVAAGVARAWTWKGGDGGWQPLVAYPGPINTVEVPAAPLYAGVQVTSSYNLHTSVHLRSLVVSLDTDGDGLTDDAEALVGTNATRRDTDGDGVADGGDASPLDPFLAAFDADGVSSDGEAAPARVYAGEAAGAAGCLLLCGCPCQPG